MKMNVQNGVLTATAETLKDVQALLALAGTPSAAKRGRASKYRTDEERRAAHRRASRLWYSRNRAKKAPEGAQVPISRIP